MNIVISLAVQSWIFYALAVSIVFARLVFRRIMLKSFADLQADDWIMVALLAPFTASIVLSNFVAKAETQQQHIHRYVLEELQIVINWLVKACLLVLYWRIFPVASNLVQRRYVQVISAICVLSFTITQISLLSWCEWARQEGDSQCQTYHNYTIISLTFSTLTTFLVLILPTPLIPTPRCFLIAILMITGILTLVLSVLSRYSILAHPESKTYLFYYTTESTLLIVFANLPFLTSLVVSTAPARIREFGRNISFPRDGAYMPLSPWPRSRRMSVRDIEAHAIRKSRWGSTATVTSSGTERKEWTVSAPVTRPSSAKHGIETLERSNDGNGWPLP
ncbi:hypothetical protein EJ07DRAFT_131174 [Lizonia empirigonia]|nr:hypothetical protein EJ07DRAFT_131174 [Lizonia empirigonia]